MKRPDDNAFVAVDLHGMGAQNAVGMMRITMRDARNLARVAAENRLAVTGTGL